MNTPTPTPNPFDEDKRPLFDLADLFCVVTLLFNLAAYCAIVYFVFHFVTKYW